MLEDLAPGFALPQFLNRQLSSNLAEIVPAVYILSPDWMVAILFFLFAKTLDNLQSLHCSQEKTVLSDSTHSSFGLQYLLPVQESWIVNLQLLI